LNANTHHLMVKDTESVAALQAALRAATRDLHHRLDHHQLLAPLVRSGLTMADYSLALQALYAINAPTEKAISDYIDAQGLGAVDIHASQITAAARATNEANRLASLS
jgi:hypothetical protein